MYKAFASACSILVLLLPTGCAVGPGTPLVDALKGPPAHQKGNVPAPEGYGQPLYAGQSSGLINPQDREATEAYLDSLANETVR
ncbi:MAG: hypothetical protein JJ866_05430 [Roseibium sp.]|uniref:hypothetical protein n=1 Tax=Roseibium sp. TaxID=1936156 RepID=UPI001B04E54D|nr:hypothetical protein [Roseibium sp.]MBO6891367.1 hypothetical protein [Roseibium sp.]MBO6929097.1 hypothetical protein [Roseibium sp.]